TLFATGGLLVAGHSASGEPLPRARPGTAPAKAAAPSSPARPAPRPPQFSLAASDSISAADIAALRDALAAARRGKTEQAAELQRTIHDLVARKLVEWTILRSDETQSIDVSRSMAFGTETPSWPSSGLLRRRAEAALWADRLDPAFVRAFFGKEQPTTTKGTFALARALLLQGDRGGAHRLVREAWRNDSFSSELENPAL